MKHIELFKDGFDSTVQEKIQPENWPYIGHDIVSGEMVYTKIINYLCLEPIDSDNQLALAKIGDYSNIQYSFNKLDWNEFTTDPTNPLNLTYISVDKPIYLRGNNPNGILNQSSGEGCKLVSSGKYNVSGDVTTLLNEEGGVKDLTPYGQQSLINLFGSIHEEISGQTIDIPSVDIVDASKLILPATVLTDGCYWSMFSDCSSLTTTPKLPATTLTDHCYYRMFYNCISLTTVPELPVTVLANYCYGEMFSGCTSLTTTPKLPATELAYGCYHRMFYNCMSLTVAPKLPATVLTQQCYVDMFTNCISLTTAPELHVNVLTKQCYQDMFRGCTSLNHITCLATDISADFCTTFWVDGVANTGTFVKHPDMNNWPTGKHGIPENWTVVDAVI